MKKSEAMASTERLAIKFSVGEHVWSFLVMLVVAAVAFMFAPESADAPRGAGAMSSVWRSFGATMGSVLDGPSKQLLSRVCGSVFAGIAASVCFLSVRYFLFLVLRKLRLVEYYRISRRLLSWSLLVTLSIALSRYFIDLFVPVTAVTVNVALGCLVIALAFHFVQVNNPLILIVAYALTGVLSALSVTGIVVLVALTMILIVSKTHIAREKLSKLMTGCGYGQAYGYGGVWRVWRGRRLRGVFP